MAEQNDLQRDLLVRIEARRSGVHKFLHENRPSIRRRTTAALVLSSLAAVFTAGPAFGGENFAGSVQSTLGLPKESTVWRVLCLAALLVSVGAAVMANLGKSQEEAVTRLGTAEAAKAELEGLSTLLMFGHLSVDEAAKLYQQYSAKIPFVEDGMLPVSGWTGPARPGTPAPRQGAPQAWQGPPPAARPRPAVPPPRPPVPPPSSQRLSGRPPQGP
jgi:hypothetical protein